MLVYFEKRVDGPEIVDDGRGWQRSHEAAAVAFCPEPRVENREDATVAPVTDEPAQPLLQSQDRERHLVFADRKSTRLNSSH